MKWKKMSRFAMKLALGRIDGPKKLLALDVGSQSTGVAVSCSSLKKSYLLKVIQNEANSPAFLKKLRQAVSSQQNLVGIIVGKPISQKFQNAINNTIDNLTKIMQSTKKSKQQQPQLMYCFEDQNYTTKQAQKKIRQIMKAVEYHGHIHDQKTLEDGIAAMKILDRFLQYYNER